MAKPHAKDEEMQQHIANWQVSGLTQTAYCKQTGLKRDVFHYYKKKLIQRRATAHQQHQLVPVKLVEKIERHSNIKISHTNGFSIDVNLGNHLDALKPLLTLLRNIK